jgi:hypothetical protein
MSKHQHGHKTASHASSVSEKNGPWPRRPFRPRSVAADVKSFDLDESLIADVRARLRPAQQVENKLCSLLGNAFIPVSHFRIRALVGRRAHC